MRITSGDFKGSILFSPKGCDVRPTLAKTRQAVFNMIRPYISDTVVVDCFAGTGAFGLEAIGNGASEAIFIENRHSDIIRKNVDKLRISHSAFRILNMDYKKGIEAMAEKGLKADILFADPPYNEGFIKNLLKILKISDILNNDSLVIAEMHKDEMEEESFQGYEIVKEKKYGDTFIILLKKKED